MSRTEPTGPVSPRPIEIAALRGGDPDGRELSSTKVGILVVQSNFPRIIHSSAEIPGESLRDRAGGQNTTASVERSRRLA